MTDAQSAPPQDRLYIAVRSDLHPGLATAQAVHAAFGFAVDHPELTTAWLRDSQYLVIVAVPDKDTLLELADEAALRNIGLHLWHEPDLDGTATALALAPGTAARRLCANLPLLGRPAAPHAKAAE